MTRLPPASESILTDLRAANLAYREAKITEYRRAQREADERILAYKLSQDRLAAEARNAGVSFARIADALHTTATSTAKEAVASGAKLGLVRAVAVEHAEKFQWNAPVLTVNLTLEDVEKIIPFIPFEREEVIADPSFLTAQFERTDSGWTCEAVAGHPVKALFFSPAFGELRAEADGVVGGYTA